MTGIELIAAERERQIKVHGYDYAHDRNHGSYILARAGVAYALGESSYWPFDDGFNRTTRKQDLVKAGALIAAAIDALSGPRR
jgi:hypothetical protein